jgi:RecA-family ATPase
MKEMSRALPKHVYISRTDKNGKIYEYLQYKRGGRNKFSSLFKSKFNTTEFWVEYDAFNKNKPSPYAYELIYHPDNCGDKGVTDMTNVHDIRERVQAARLAPTAQSDPVPMLPLLDPSAWEGVEMPAREWALQEWIPAHQATYLTGPGSAGKSLLSQLLCTCIAMGLPFMGIDTQAAVAVYITCEDDAEELHRRQKAICTGLGLSLAALKARLHLVSLVGEIGNELATFTPEGTMSVTPAYERLRATILAIDAKLIVLDNVAHLFAGNENIRNQVAAFVGLLNKLAQEAGAAILFLGHPNKAGADYSGSTAWENQVRSRLFMEVPRDADGSVIDPDARRLARGKANYARNGETIDFRWYQGTFVRADDLPPNVAEEMAANAQASAENDRFLKCLQKVTEERRATSPNRAASNYAPRIFAKMTIGKGITEAGFEAALERLLHLGMIQGDQRVYQRDNRSWALGLGCTNPCTNHANSGAQSLHEPAQSHSTDLRTVRPPMLKHREGGASEGPPPSPEGNDPAPATASAMATQCRPAPDDDPDDPAADANFMRSGRFQ